MHSLLQRQLQEATDAKGDLDMDRFLSLVDRSYSALAATEPQSAGQGQISYGQLEEALESLSDGIAVFDEHDLLILHNRRFTELFNIHEDPNRAGQTFEELLRGVSDKYKLDGVNFEDWLSRRMTLHREATGEPFFVHTSEGKWLLARECRMASGGVVSVRTDITEIKQRQNQIDALKQRYQIILDSAGEGIVGLDQDGIIRFANRTACALLMYEPEELVGRLFCDLLHCSHMDGVCDVTDEQPIAGAYRLGASQHISGELFWRKDGSNLPVDYFCGPLMDGDAISGAVLAFRDATLRLQYVKAVEGAQRELEQKVAARTRELMNEVDIRARTEDALRQSRARMKGITDCLLEGVLVVNAKGDLVFSNPAARAMLCPDCDDELEGLPMDGLVKLGGDTLVSFADGPWPSVAEGKQTVRNDDATFVTADGRTLSVAYACSAQVVEGSAAACVILFRDIGELKSAQWDAMQASRMASVGQLAAGIAHEINTPTQYIGDNLEFIAQSLEDIGRAIAGARALADSIDGPQAAELAKLLADLDLDYLLEEVPNAVRQSLEGVRQVSRIVLSMKEFSHPGSASRMSANINRALESTLMVTRNTWKHVAEVELDLDPDLPPVLCYAAELNQVFLNLIVNAAHAIEALHSEKLGRISVSTRADGSWVRIRIADTGTGIPESIRDKIFDPFFTTKPVGKGTGQGLAICRDVVVNKHCGRLDVQSVEGQGAAFTVSIPMQETAEDAGQKDV